MAMQAKTAAAAAAASAAGLFPRPLARPACSLTWLARAMACSFTWAAFCLRPRLDVRLGGECLGRLTKLLAGPLDVFPQLTLARSAARRPRLPPDCPAVIGASFP